MSIAENPRRIAVIGAGIIGACAAHELTRRGHNVILIDAEAPGGEQAASFGNGAFISPASIIPMSMPGLWRSVPGYLCDRTGPLTISLRALPRLTPWLLRFLWAGATMARTQRTIGALHALLKDGPERHMELALQCGVPELIRQDGLLYTYFDRAAFVADARIWNLRHEHGLVWREFEGQSLRDLEPSLSPRYSFAVLLEQGAHCTDPGAYVRAISEQAVKQGAKLLRGHVSGFTIRAGRLLGIETETSQIDCEIAVIANGISAGGLARKIGDRIPLEAERGYHVAIGAPNITLRRPVMPNDGKMANTMTAGCLRAAGQVELSRADAAPDWRRADVLLHHLRAAYPQLAIPEGSVRRWQGNRPSTADGLPVIGRSRHSQVFHAFGHGHIGLNAAPATAKLLADLIDEYAPEIDPTPYAASRF
jgi:D-amino-acid dehydrogenase